ncbi:MAG: hypothetical protein ACXVBZ_01835 [Flavisolibacter sp.]
MRSAINGSKERKHAGTVKLLLVDCNWSYRPNLFLSKFIRTAKEDVFMYKDQAREVGVIAF